MIDHLSPMSPKGDRSMLSTQLTKNRSAIASFYGSERKKMFLSSYQDIPIPKQTPKWNQSTATWRNTSHRYSFSKDQRFKQKKPVCQDLLEPQIPSTLGNKYCTFGLGGRAPISEVVLRNAKQKPSPDAYSKKIFDEQPRSPKHGQTFTSGWKNCEKLYIDHRKDMYSSHFVQGNPPAKYQVRQVPGKHKRSFTTYDRLKMYTSKMSDITRMHPGPIYKVKERHLHNNVGMNQRSFGFGERIDLSAPANENPQAIYKIEGFCEKFAKTKKKNIPKKLLK